MHGSLHVLDSTGDIKISWDTENPAEVEEARKAIDKLAEDGYVFFLADGSALGNVADAKGMVISRMISAEEAKPVATPPAPARKGGKRGKRAVEPDTAVVATRPARGG